MITGKLSTTDEKRFRKNLQQLVALSKEPVEDIMRSQGRLFAVEAAEYTPRFGTSAQVGKNQQARMQTDIGRVYKNATQSVGLIARHMGMKAAEKFKGYIAAKNSAKAEAMFRTANLASKYYGGRTVKFISWDGGAAHKKFTKGKLRGGAPVFFVFQYSKVKAYKKSIQKKAGEAKSGWAKAALQLGGAKGIPAYAKKKYHKTRGRGAVLGKNSKAELTIANYSRYVKKSAMMEAVWAGRLAKIQKLVERMIKNRGRKITRRT